MIYICSGLLTELEISEAQAEARFTVTARGLGFAKCPDQHAIDRLAQHAYHAYGATTDYKNFRGEPMPEWKDLPDQIRAAWRSAAADIVFNLGYLHNIGPTGDTEVSLPGSIREFRPSGLIGERPVAIDLG